MCKLEENSEFLSALYAAKDGYDIRKLIRHASESEIATLVELIVNFLDGNIRLPDDLLKKMAANADFYRTIRRTRTINGARQKLINGEFKALKLLIDFVYPEIERILEENE